MSDKMDRQKVLADLLTEMKAIASGEARLDEEDGHMRADSILCEALELFGQAELTEAFYNVPKWYA